MIIQALYAGKPQAFGPRQTPSSIIKTPHQQLTIDMDGAQEDEQGNKKIHGGPEMALHQYALDSYAILQKQFPEIANKLQPGSIGENMSVPDMNDENVYIGDTYEIGSVVLQVNSPRAPCVKINQRYDAKNVDIFVAQNGITGWYFRVLETGTIKVGDPVKLVHRIQNTMSIKEIIHLVRSKDNNLHDRLIAAEIPGLSKEWVRKLKKV